MRRAAFATTEGHFLSHFPRPALHFLASAWCARSLAFSIPFELRQHHLHESAVRRAVRAPVVEAGLAKQATCHSLRHDVATTMIYAHVPSKGGKQARN
jgi:integrase